MCIYIYKHKHLCTIFTDCLITCILSNGEVIKYHIFISVVVLELSVRCLNTGPEDRLPTIRLTRYAHVFVMSSARCEDCI